MNAKPEKGRHPDFDKHWDSHFKLIWWLDKKLCNRWNKEDGHFVGWLTLVYNRCLWHWKPEKSKLSTYLTNAAWISCWKEMIRKETDEENLQTDSLGKRRDLRRVTFDVVRNRYVQAWKPDDRWTDEYLENFDSPGQFWRWLTRGMDAKRRRMFLQRERHGKMLWEIGEVEGLTKERVRQAVNEASAMAKRKLSGEST